METNLTGICNLSAGNNEKVVYGLCKSQTVKLLGPTCAEEDNSERAIACLVG